MQTNASGTQETTSAVQDMANQAKEKVERAVEGMSNTSRERIQDVTARATGKTAAAIDRATDYVRNTDFREQLDDLWMAMRRNPAPSLIAAAAVGFILGVTLRRS